MFEILCLFYEPVFVRTSVGLSFDNTCGPDMLSIASKPDLGRLVWTLFCHVLKEIVFALLESTWSANK